MAQEVLCVNPPCGRQGTPDGLESVCGNMKASLMSTGQNSRVTGKKSGCIKTGGGIMQTIKGIVSLIFVALLASCASEYSAKGMFNGYSDVRLGENVFRVSFQGDGYDNRERVTDLALLRSAEVALANGFQYFVIANAADNSTGAAYTMPRTTQTNATVYGNTLAATSTSYGGQTFFITYPNTTNTIYCFKQKPDIGVLVYDARYVSSSLRSKYGIK
jgi:hypothetical protein